MRRAVALTAILGLFVAGLGCKHVAGKNDCYYNPEDNVLPSPSNPYFPVGSPITGPVLVKDEVKPKDDAKPKDDTKPKDEPKEKTEK